MMIYNKNRYERFKWWSLHVLKIVHPIILGSEIQNFLELYIGEHYINICIRSINWQS